MYKNLLFLNFQYLCINNIKSDAAKIILEKDHNN